MGARSLAERVAEKEAQLEKAQKKADQYKEQLKQLQARHRSEEQRQRTHKLIVCGAEIAALFERVLDQDEVLVVVNFLREQKELGNFTLEKTKTAETEEPRKPEKNTDQDNNDWFNGMFDF